MKILDPIDLVKLAFTGGTGVAELARKAHAFRFTNAVGQGNVAAYRNDPQWWQNGYGPPTGNQVLGVSTVYSCVKIISEEMARLNIQHLITDPDVGLVETTQSAPARVLRNPNRYQTRSDFILYMMLQLLKEGNSYAFVTRDARGAVSELHPLPSKGATPQVVWETGEIYYHFSTFDVSHYAADQTGLTIPQYDVLHLRLFTPTHPLIGMTPLLAAAVSMSTHEAINGQSSDFFSNMARMAGILTTPKALDESAARRLKLMWKAAKAGGTPILDNDIKYQPYQMTAVESEVIEHFNLSLRQIANIYRIPLDFLGETDKNTYNNVEQMQKRFILSTLGFYLEHLETAFDKFFGLPPSQAIKFDLESALMRPDFKERMEGLSKGVTGGVMTPNEARKRENLAPVDGGDQIYMQRQNWPLDMLGQDSPTMESNDGGSGGSDDSEGDQENMMDFDQMQEYLDAFVDMRLAA